MTTMPVEPPDKSGVNPIDVVKQIADANKWEMQRDDNETIQLFTMGSDEKCAHHFYILWSPELKKVHVMCFLDAQLPKEPNPNIAFLLMFLNPKIISGSFSMDHQGVSYRHTISTKYVNNLEEQLKEVMEEAIRECELHRIAFNMVLEGRLTPFEASNFLYTDMGETVHVPGKA